MTTLNITVGRAVKQEAIRINRSFTILAIKERIAVSEQIGNRAFSIVDFFIRAAGELNRAVGDIEFIYCAAGDVDRAAGDI